MRPSIGDDHDDGLVEELGALGAAVAGSEGVDEFRQGGEEVVVERALLAVLGVRVPAAGLDLDRVAQAAAEGLDREVDLRVEGPRELDLADLADLAEQVAAAEGHF